jgi:uncharacterized protein
LICVYTVQVLVEALVGGVFPLPVVVALMSVAPAIAAVAFVGASRRILRAPRSLSGYGVAVDRHRLVDLFVGLAIGMIGASVPVVVAIVSGSVEVVAVLDDGAMSLWPGIGLTVFAMFFVGLWEELLLRGVFLRNAADGFRRWMSPRCALAGGVILSAVVFGLAHFAQPEHAAFIVTWILVGLILGTVYVVDGNLGLVIGAHAALNIAYNVFFVRTDLARSEQLSAVTRVQVDPTQPLLGSGGLLDVSAYTLVGLLCLLWLRYSRGSVSVNVDTVPGRSLRPPSAGDAQGDDSCEFGEHPHAASL